MRIHVRIDRRDVEHTTATVFVNGANTGQLTMRGTELADVLQALDVGLAPAQHELDITIPDAVRLDSGDLTEASFHRRTTALTCRDYRPGHNGECLTCDEPLDAHCLWLLDRIAELEREVARLKDLLTPIRIDLSCGCKLRIPATGEKAHTIERCTFRSAGCDLQRLAFVAE